MKRRGFSLMELIVSIGIIGTSLILVVGIFTMLVNGSQKASDLTSGSVIADGLLSQQLYQIASDTTVREDFFKAAYGTPTPYRGGTYSLNNTVYFYKIYVQDVAVNGNLHYASTDGTRGETYLKRFDVVLWWNDSAAASQADYRNLTMNQQARQQGMQQVHLTRLLWADGSF